MLASADLPSRLGVEDGTALGHGLAGATNLLTATPAAHKIVILLTDGVETATTFAPTAVAKAVRQHGIIVYNIGLGKSGLVPFPQGSGDDVVLLFQAIKPLPAAIMRNPRPRKSSPIVLNCITIRPMLSIVRKITGRRRNRYKKLCL